MKFSVYTSLFKPESGLFDISGAINNWREYSDEIVFGTFPEEVEKIRGLVENDLIKTKVVSVDTSVSDPYFDGKLKNAALQACSNEYVIQQDMDERIGGHFDRWLQLILFLKGAKKSSCMVPVIDLFKDYNHFKSVGYKWYFHKKEGCYRGPVNFARRADGTIDVTRSDTCELIDSEGNLVPFITESNFIKNNGVGTYFDKEAPHIIHLGYLNFKKRVDNNKFWGKVWSAREGKEVQVIESEEELSKIPFFQHNLEKEWWI